jgi:Tfp pilus assembly protein PilF
MKVFHSKSEASAIAFSISAVVIFGWAETKSSAENRAGTQAAKPLPTASFQSIVRRADYFREHGEIEKALPLYSQAIEIDKNQPDAFVGRAYVYEEFGKVDKALADFSAAVKIGHPKQRNNWLARRKRADLYQSLHHKNRAEIYKRMGKHDLAKNELQLVREKKNANLDLAPFATNELRAPKRSK